MMRIDTAYFGCLRVAAGDVLRFPFGLPGWKECHRWVLLNPYPDSVVSWLQCVDRPAVAFAVVEPRRFVPDYQVRVYPRELSALELDNIKTADVWVTLNQTEKGLALNLKGPLVINWRRRLGRQVITNGKLPVQYLLQDAAPWMRKKIA